MSFKSFIQTQPEDHPPEIFQQMYEQYNIDYLGYFSESFFKASMGEEWFQDRYNPINIMNIEKESATWALDESRRFKQKLVDNPVSFIQACSLEPNARHRDADLANDEVVLSGKHLPGHENRTVYVSGIHACCPKAVLQTAITNALTNNGTEEGNKPDRIVISQPVWHSRQLDKFERTAWVVMPTSSLARQAMNILRDTVVKVPSVPDPKTGLTGTAFTFTIQAALHSPRHLPVAPEHLSSVGKVRADVIRAMHLAHLLDEDREIPSEQRLHEILLHPSVTEAIKKPVDHLDVAIAYLRRVHFVAFYSGKRYRDESHLLAMAPAVLYRSKIYAPAPNENQPYSVTSILGEIKQGTDSNTLVVPAEENEEGGNSEKAEETPANPNKTGSVHSSKAEDSGDAVMDTATNAADGEISETKATPQKPPAPPLPPGSSGSVVLAFKGAPVADRKIGPIIADLTQKLAIKKARAQDPSLPGTIDEEDARQLENIQDRTNEELIKSRCKFEIDDKCRCCFPYCNKLFKAVSFLVKHMKTKHTEFGFEALLQDAEPFMRRRYEQEDMSARPLPPVEVESFHGIELRSVKDIVEKYMKSLFPLPPPPSLIAPPPPGFVGSGPMPPMIPPPLPAGPPPSRYNREDSYRGGGDSYHRKRSRNYSDDVPNDSNGPTTFSVDNSPPPQGSFNRRKSFPPPGPGKLNAYLDVDAPKESVVDVDYGVAVLPILKKRKLGLKTAAVTKLGAATETNSSSNEAPINKGETDTPNA